MQNKDSETKKYIVESPRSLKDYILLVSRNIRAFVIISAVILLAALAYALYTPNVYRSTVILRVIKQPDNILQQASAYPTINELDRFISNEIGVITNYDTREKVAKALVEKVENAKDKSIFKLLVVKNPDNGTVTPKSEDAIADILRSSVKVDQEPDKDAIDISADSRSPEEAALIANTYADQYQSINLAENRRQLSEQEKFLLKQSTETKAELDSAEAVLANFKEKGKVVALDAQSTALIDQLSQLNAERNAAKIDLMSSNQVLAQYKKEINQQNPELVNYMENQTSQAYIGALQKQIAELQMNRDMALANSDPNLDISGKIKEYDRQINDLKAKLSTRINNVKADAYASSPDQIKDKTQKLMEEEVRNRSLSIKLNELNSLIGSYNSRLETLPRESMQLSLYQRNVESLEQLYTQVEQKYQEVHLNKLSKSGNVLILSRGRVPDKPEKPSRAMIVLIGLFGGIAAAMGFILSRDYFKDTLKVPEKIELKEKEMKFIPPAENSRKAKQSLPDKEVLTLKPSQATANEAFNAVDNGLQMTLPNNNQKRMIAVSAARNGEGKASVALNLANRFAQSNQVTLLIDCDLRAPMVHNVLNTINAPGLSEYLSGRASLKEVIKKDGGKLYYITAGSLTGDSSSLLTSNRMERFLNEIRNLFDVIIINSAPVLNMQDNELLAKYVDGIILVDASDKPALGPMNEALNLIKEMQIPFLGTVLNNNNRTNLVTGKQQHHSYPLRLNNTWR